MDQVNQIKVGDNIVHPRKRLQLPTINPRFKDIQFGRRRFLAPAQRIWEDCHVYRLQVPASPIARWLSSCRWMPRIVLSWLPRLLPE